MTGPKYANLAAMDSQSMRETIDLVVDACVAIENMLYPELADERCNAKEVNKRLLAWIERYCLDEPGDEFL